MDTRFTSIYESFKIISNKIKNSSYEEISSSTGKNNLSNDIASELDLYSNSVIEEALFNIPKMCGYLSEEKAEPVFFENRDYSNYNLFCLIDPLDGSKNIDINGITGSIYTIVSFDPSNNSIGNILEAGYVLYGPKTLLVIGNESSDDSLKVYELKNFDLWSEYTQIKSFHKRSIEESNTYFINESYSLRNEDSIQELLYTLKCNNFSQRWTGSMVSDCHQLFLKGGIFAYPGILGKKPYGKLRYLYEVLPFSYLIEILGGQSILGNSCFDIEKIGENIKQKSNEELHQPIEIILLSPKFKSYMEKVLNK